MLGELSLLTKSLQVPIEKRVSKEHFQQERNRNKMVCICTIGILNKRGHLYLIDDCLVYTNTVCMTSVKENKRNRSDSLHNQKFKPLWHQQEQHKVRLICWSETRLFTILYKVQDIREPVIDWDVAIDLQRRCGWCACGSWAAGTRYWGDVGCK